MSGVKRVLILEDNQIKCDLLRTLILQCTNTETKTACIPVNVYEGRVFIDAVWSAVRDNKAYDLFIIDMSLPGHMQGPDVISMITSPTCGEKIRTTPIMLCSSDWDKRQMCEDRLKQVNHPNWKAFDFTISDLEPMLAYLKTTLA